MYSQTDAFVPHYKRRSTHSVIAEIDALAAYHKGHPIRSATEIAEKFSTTPINDEWMARIQENHWYHGNNNVDEYLLRDPKNGHRMLELRDKLLSFGGQEACLPVYEEDLVKILDRGQLWVGDRITMMRGRPSQCHMNSAYCWDANKDKAALCTGYALSSDGLWRQHSWCIHLKPRKNRVVETTVERIAYFGFVMTEQEATEFYFDNE